MVVAGTARTYYPDKRITLVRDVQQAVVPCGIPYIFRRLGSVEKNVVPDTGLCSHRRSMCRLTPRPTWTLGHIP